jgi:predicted transcriptional regulator
MGGKRVAGRFAGRVLFIDLPKKKPGMEKAILKERLHKLIDAEEDELKLESIFQTLKGSERDILDDLTPEQRQRLNESLEQARRGEVIPHEVVKAEIEAWLTR